MRPVGSQSEIKIYLRILSATHKKLSDLVRDGAFREDLYYRINVIEIVVPPLRERREDLPEIAHHVLGRLCSEARVAEPSLDDEAMAALRRYAFPGNVRELENVLERALTMCEGDRITADDLGLDVSASADDSPAPPQLDESLEDLERQRILEALERTRWNKTAAARELGITFRALRYRLKKFGLE